MSLTLKQFAQAIIDDRKFLFVDLGEYHEIDAEAAARYWGDFPGQVSIKPKPREYWLIPYTDKLGYKVCETHHSQWAPEVNVAGLNFAGIIHVKEVL